MNLQNIVKIEALRVAAIATWQATPLKCSISVATGRSWTNLDFTAGSARMTDNVTDTDSGLLHTSKVECSVSGDDENLSRVCDMFAHDSVVKVTYNDGTVKVVGQPNFPSRMTIQQEVGNSSIHRLSFQCKSPVPPLILV